MENTDSLASIMNLMKLFTPKPGPSAAPTASQQSWPMFPIDEKIHTEPLRVCKSLIPYLSFENQRDISILIKLFELVSVAQYFSQPEASKDPSLSLTRSDSWQTDLLTSVRNNLDPKNAYLIDILFKINDVKDILASAQSSPPPSPQPKLQPKEEEPSKDFVDNISPNLTDGQKNLLKMLSTVMK